MRTGVLRRGGALARPPDLLLDPGIGLGEPALQRLARRPAEPLLDELVVGIAAAHPERSRNVLDRQALAGDLDDHPRELVDRDHLVGADIDRPREIRAHQAKRALDAFVDIEEGARLLAIAPDVDGAAVARFGDLAAERRRCFLAAALPGPFRTEDVVIARDPRLDAVV